jgi:hypothetical protein
MAIDADLARVATLQRALGHLEEKLGPVLALLGDGGGQGDGAADAAADQGHSATFGDGDGDAPATPSLSPLDRAKASVAVAYATASLYFIMLKLKGHNTTDHEVCALIPTRLWLLAHTCRGRWRRWCCWWLLVMVVPLAVARRVKWSTQLNRGAAHRLPSP